MVVGVEVLPIIVVELLVQGEQPDQVEVVLLVHGMLLVKKMELLILVAVAVEMKVTTIRPILQDLLAVMVVREL